MRWMQVTEDVHGVKPSVSTTRELTQLSVFLQVYSTGHKVTY